MRLAIMLAFLLNCALPAVAETHLVKPDGTGDFATIQAAIYAAESGDVIQLENGIFSGPGNRDLDFQGRAITVCSLSGNAAACVIDCQGEIHRGFRFASGETEASVIEGLTVRNGNVEYFGSWPENCGGAILCRGGSSPTVGSCRFVNNRALIGGAACVVQSSPHFYDCVFSDNDAVSMGGAVCCSDYSSVAFNGCEFVGNSANSAGAVFSEQSTVGILGCRFVANIGLTAGGAIQGWSVDLTAENCWIGENISYGPGGGFHLRSSSGVLVGCTVVLNYAGGAGGGVFSEGGVLDITSSTFSENFASLGGGIHAASITQLGLARSIVAFSPNGGGVRLELGSTAEISCTDIYGNCGGDWVGPIYPQLHLYGNLCEDPFFCDPEDDDFTLWNYSPCLRVGCGLIGAWGEGCSNPAGVPEQTVVDGQEGIPSSWGGVKALFRN